MEKVSILSIGVATMDLYQQSGKMYPGGNEYNIAYHAQCLGANAGFMGVFADDLAGEILQKILCEKGIDISHSHNEKGSSGFCFINIVEGDRVFGKYNKNSVTDLKPIDFTDDDIKYMKQFDIVHISMNGRVSAEKMIAASNQGVRISYDFGEFFNEELYRRLCPYLEYAFFSCSHIGKDKTVQILKEAVALGCKVAIGTRGKDSALAYGGNELMEQEVRKVKVKDTMGAGDSYICAFLLNYLSEMKADESHIADDKIKHSLSEAAKFAAEIVAKDGSLGIGYDIDLSRISDYFNVKEEGI